MQQAPEVNLNDTALNLKDLDDGRVSATFKNPMQSKPRWGRSTAQYTWPMSGHTTERNVCLLEFNIPNNIKPPILFYYRLTNFYQNHRRYVKSVDIEQLKGKARTADDIKSGDCTPLNVDGATGKPYYPCGLIANSMFNDTFDNLTMLGQGSTNGNEDPVFYNMTTQGTSWAHEGDLYGKTAYKPDQVAVPLNWREQYANGSYEGLTELPDLHTWEEFQVWMRTAGLPTFSKLYQRNENTMLMSGTYRLRIYDSKRPYSSGHLDIS